MYMYVTEYYIASLQGIYSEQRRQSGFKIGMSHVSGFKNGGGVVCPKSSIDGGT